MAEQLIKVTKDGEVIEIHPLALDDHQKLGWQLYNEITGMAVTAHVADALAAEEKAAADALAAEEKAAADAKAAQAKAEADVKAAKAKAAGPFPAVNVKAPVADEVQTKTKK